MSTINGTNLIVQVNGTAVSLLKSCDLDTTHAGRDTTTKDDAGWETGAEGKRAWKVTGSGDVADKMANFTALFLLYTNRTRVQVSFNILGSAEKYYYGYAYLDSLKQVGPLEETATFDFGFKGDGVLTEATHT